MELLSGSPATIKTLYTISYKAPEQDLLVCMYLELARAPLTSVYVPVVGL